MLVPTVRVQAYTCVALPVVPAVPGAEDTTVTVNDTLTDLAAVQGSGASLVVPSIG